MNIFKDLISNDILICSVVGYLLAQILKVFTVIYEEKRFDIHRLWGAGGMPSSHSAAVCALAFSCARTLGVGSPLFAFSVVIAGVVMYDATGVRRAAGEQAKLLNHIETDLFSGNPEYSQKALKELIGHTPLQVVAGAVLGILIGLFFPSLAPLVA